ncbi:MAG: hypothetical protein JW717_05280 [Marinilabiliaceae bacterium]|nr:hypothetical protein [Marinilabiliaceae bacterium]
MPQETKTTNHKTLYFLLIGLIIVLIGAVIFLFHSKESSEVVIDEMVIEKELLARDFQELALEYDSIYTSNDTLNRLLTEERERIVQLIEEIRTIKSANAAKINEYKKELSSLRNVMKSFVVQIDSLNARNQELTEENIVVKTRYTKIQDSYKELEEEKKGLVQKVEIASRLEIRNVEITPLNHKGKATSRNTRTSKIKVCFTLLKNLTAPVGEKNIYIRITRPDGELLIKSKEDLFEFENSSISYSAFRTVEYGGEDLDVCVFYNVDEGELTEGTYIVDIFADGNNIGSSNFDMK